MEAAHSLCISPDGEKLYCGFNRSVKIFDVKIAGRSCQSRPTKCQHNINVYLYM